MTAEEVFRNDYLTLGQLAAHLGWSTRFVEGLVRGEKLPALEIGGSWHFRREEVVDWLEQKIRTLDAGHIADLERRMETALHADEAFRSRRGDRLTSSLPLKGISLDLAVSTKSAVLRALVELAEGTGLLFDKDFLLASLVDREALCSTALPGGVALCHPRRPAPSVIGRSFLCYLRTAEPVGFGAEDGEGTSHFFLLCTPDDRSHLQGLARLARILHAGGLNAIRTAASPESIKETLSDIEARVSA